MTAGEGRGGRQDHWQRRGGRVRAVLDRALDLVVPPACVVCGRHVPAARDGEHRRICPGCFTRIRPIGAPRCIRCSIPLGTMPEGAPEPGDCRDCGEWPGVLVGAASASLLEGPVADVVHAFKYGGWPELAEEMSRPMAQLHGALPERLRRAPLVPVPTTAVRLRRRGYNQARRLARALGRRVGCPVADLLERVSGSASQVALHRSQRRANVRGAFALREGSGVGPLPDSVVVVDDVLTTGATVVEVAETLEAGGVREVQVLSFARARSGGQGTGSDGPADAPARLLDALRVRRAGRRASGPPIPSSKSSDPRS